MLALWPRSEIHRSPSLNFFRFLPPASITKVWAVYALLFEKPVFLAKLYVGSIDSMSVEVLQRCFVAWG